MRNKIIEIAAGLFMILGLVGLSLLAFKVSGLTSLHEEAYYKVSANFDEIGNLKVRAPVLISGVKVGRVTDISLDQNTFRAKVLMHINKEFFQIPIDSSASILTQGLLGSNYIGITPGFETNTLKAGGLIETTHSALILENLLGQLLFNLKSSDKNTEKPAEKSADSSVSQ